MRLKTEIINEPQKILLVVQEEIAFVKKLKKHLAQMDIAVSIAAAALPNYDNYTAVFFIQYIHEDLAPIEKSPNKKFIFVLFDEPRMARHLTDIFYKDKHEHVRVVNLETYPQHYDGDIATLLWFAFSQTQDIFLHIYHEQPKAKLVAPRKPSPKKLPLHKRIAGKHIILAGLIITILTPFFFIIPLAVSFGGLGYAYRLARSGDVAAATRIIRATDGWYTWGKDMYAPSKPLMHFLGMGFSWDTAIEINRAGRSIIMAIPEGQSILKTISEGMYLKAPTARESEAMIRARNDLASLVSRIGPDIISLSNLMPDWHSSLADAKDYLQEMHGGITLFTEVNPYLDEALGKDADKKYLLLFANNMELRPGGGFIGSYAIVTVRHFGIRSISVYDVYDADGQLIRRVEPPAAISQYLEQPFWYLRDSAFSPDFPENAKQAEFFLKESMNQDSFEGVILITTTAVKSLLGAMGPLSIPDYGEIITQDNFYMKAQLYAESDFFPGSIQKKRFLESVMTQLLLALPQASPLRLAPAVTDSFDEKQIVMWTRNTNIQRFLNERYWSGALLEPVCTTAPDKVCVADYLYQFDANLGVNKANFFIRRESSLAAVMDSSGKITNTAIFRYDNDSQEGVFPGGSYKNYFQLYLPQNTVVSSIRIDDVSLDDYDETNFDYKRIGFLLNVPPQASRTVTIQYSLPTTVISGSGTYQLLMQKQVGSPHANFQFSFQAPGGTTVVPKNISSLAKGNQIIYNTSVSSDKIILIDFSK